MGRISFCARWSIRTNLLLVVSAALLPALLLLGFRVWRELNRETERVQLAALREADDLAEIEGNFADSAHQLLSAISAVPSVRHGDAEAASRLFQELLARNPLYANILATDQRGKLLASAVPAEEGISYADRPYFQDAVRSKVFVAGEFLISRTTNRRIFPFALPVLDTSGAILCVLIASQDLQNATDMFAHRNLSTTTELLLVDREGTVLQSFNANESRIGKPLQPSELARIQNGSRTVFRSTDERGASRLYAASTLRLPGQEPFMFFRLGIPEQTALAGVRRHWYLSLCAMGGAYALALGTTWLLGGMLVRRPVRQLLTATSRLARGEWDAAANLPRDRNELGRLGTALGLLGEDLRERERAVVASEAVVRSVLDAMNDAVFLCDLETGRILGTNRRSRELYLHSESAFLGLSLEALAESPTLIHDALEKMRLAHENVIHLFEWQAKANNGRVFWVESHMRRAYIAGMDRLLIVVRDIQERKLNEAERQRLEIQVQQAQKLESIGMLAGGVAHDFNNLLTAMLGNLAIAQGETDAEGSCAKHIRRAEQVAHRAAELTKQLLVYAGRSHASTRALELNPMIQDISQLLEVNISRKIQLKVHLTPGLPAIQGDAAQLQQVFMNLLTNAAEAIQDQEGVITLQTSLCTITPDLIRSDFHGQSLEPGIFVSLDVEDTGCGMSPDVLSRIFDPFYTTKRTGHGLGLSAMRGILKAHRGGIRIHSVEGQGSVFRIVLPVSPSAGLESEAPKACAAPERLQGTVLLIEDEDNIRQASRGLLERLGFTVQDAGDGHEGLECFRRSPDAFDFVFTDLAMPRMDGKAMFQAIHALRPNVPVIMCSGFADEDVVAQLVEEGLAAFISKPYTQEDLRSAIWNGVFQKA
ncbi:MAG TPA: response regulator [Holophaga sp.]|nr:response regulator [Holophaga sp.]